MNSEYLQKLQKSYQEAVDWSAQANVRYGSKPGTSSDKSVSNAVDKALANPGTSHSASETKGKTGVSGSGSFSMSGSFGGSSSPESSTSPGSSSPSSPKASKGNGEPVPTFGAKKMPEKKLSLKMDIMSDIDTYNLVLEYLLDEGFASTEQAADKIISNMSESWFESILEEGMTMKDFKANRKKLQRKEASVDAEKRGHEGKEWYNSGRKYGTDEAKSRRSKMSDDERAARHRASVDPDDDRDENMYSADKTKDPKKLRKQKAMGELTKEEYIDEAEGSYGKTPKATAAYGKLANERRSKPASEYSERGEKKSKVSSAEKHMNRSRRTAADHSGKKSTKPAWHSYQRDKMTQSDRDHLRGQSEYGHVGYDPDGDGGPSGPGSKPKGKKLERQKKTGVSAESFNAYEVVFEYLLDEGFASTEKAADKIILNMSEAWFEDIMELNRLEREQGKESGGTKDPAMRIMKKKLRDMQGKPEGQRKKEPGKKPPKAGEYGGPASPAQKVAKRRAAAKAAQDFMSDTRGT